MDKLVKLCTQLRLAVSFLTLMPVAPKETVSDYDWGRSVRFFPVVGYIFGLINVFIVFSFYWLNNLLSYFFTKFNYLFNDFGLDMDFNLEPLSGQSWLIALSVTLVNIFINGGLHLDGLMDTFDGIAANKPTREETLAVMKDSHVGAFGSMACTIVLLTKIISLAQINYQANFKIALAALFLVPIWVRALMIIVIASAAKQSRTGGSSDIFFKNFKKHDPIVSLVFVVVAVLLAYTFNYGEGTFFLLLVSLTFAILFSYCISLWLRKKLKGHNGDTLGAGVEIAEALMYFIIAVII